MEKGNRSSGTPWDGSLLSAPSQYQPALLIQKHQDLPAAPTRSSWHFLHMVRGTIWGIGAIFSHSAALCVEMARICRLCASPLRTLCVLLPLSRSLLCSESKKGQQMGNHRLSPGAWQASPSCSHSSPGLSLLHIIYTGLKSSFISA